MRQFYSSPHQPRRGQALLLAVLIMIFAALLSASFITVVSVNLNQTARQADKNRATASAKAGLDYVNRQLAFSDKGENWRPDIPNLNSGQYTAYYTPLDRAQGWAGSFAKYPNPLDEQGNNNGPQFLAKVERIPFNLTSASPDFDKAGQLKITVIGLSPEDPTAYSRTIFYKGGYQNAPIAQNMRVVSNWDFKNGVVPVAQSAGYVDNASNPRTVTLKNIKGEFPEPPFAVMIGDPTTFANTLAATGTGQVVRGAVVVKKDVVASVTTLQFAYPGANNSLNIRDNERIELAASIGAPNGLDYNNTGIPQAIPTLIAVKVADNSTPGGLRINGGLWLTGKASAFSLRAPSDPNGAGIVAPATIRASGLFARELDANAGGSPTVFDVQGQGISGTSTALLRSDQLTFPGGWAFPTGFTPAYDRRSKDQLVSDAWNRLAGVPSGVATTSSNNSTATRSVTSFIPPAIDSGEGLDRYRKLTRFSPAVGTNESASLYGGGQGIYINNAQDRERIYSGTALRDMTQAEMVNMWVSRPIPSAPLVDYMRIGAPIAANSLVASLEQQHLRGWVGPDEFRGRGVEIELGNNSLVITRDARDDNRPTNPDGTIGTSNALGGVNDKTWKNPATGANQPGIYSQTFAWPQNGVVFAEGNVRIRGNATNVPRSLTVVSMGNIYIEDSLSADDAADGLTVGAPRKILLLATKNVVMNPTRVLGRPDAQTTVTTIGTVTAGPPVTQTLTVADGLSFRIGDYVQTSATVNGAINGRGYVVAPAPTATTINLSSVTGTIANGDFIHTPNVAPQVLPGAAGVTPFVPFSTIGSPDDVIQRRFNAAATNVRIAFNHGANRVNGLKVETENFGGGTRPATGIFLSNKRVLDATGSAFVPSATNIAQANKQVRGDYSSPAPAGTDVFPATFSAQDLTALKTEMEAKTHLDAPNNIGWKYKVTLTPYVSIPFFYLAGVGNRYDFGATPPLTVGAGLSGWQGKIDKSDIAANAYDVPVATSIALWLNSPTTPSLMTNENWNGTAYDQTAAFGFDPTFPDAATANREDILTGDQGFYQTDANIARSTLDSRSLTANVGTNSLVLRQSDNLVGVTSTTPLAAYRLRSLKAENVGLTASSSTVNAINPGYTFNVNAYVYAQTGSWFVIPSGLFDNRLRGTFNPTTGEPTSTYLDIANANPAVPAADPGEYLDGTNAGNTIGTFDSGDFADLNRNGIIEDSEKYAMARYSRYNYDIKFNGAITENQTPIVNTMKDSSGGVVANGAVEAWMLSWSTVAKQAVDDPATTGVDESLLANGRMTYTFDSDYVRGRLVDDPTTLTIDETDTGFRLPQTTEVFDVS